MRFRNRKQDDDSTTESEAEMTPNTTTPEDTSAEVGEMQSDATSKTPEALQAEEPRTTISDEIVLGSTVSFLDGPEGEEHERLPRRSAATILRKTVAEFIEDQGTDLAAALTYYGVLAIFPAALAIFSTLGLFGQGEKGVNFVLDVLRPLVSSDFLNNIRTPLHSIAHSNAAGVTFAVGLIAALWSASAYVGAFGRAMNRVYEVDEGRPWWRLRPMNFVVTILTTTMCTAGLLIMLVSGSVARSVGKRMGVGHQAVQVWDIAKWPVLLILVIGVIALLYHLTPNIRQGRPRFLSVGASFAILVWLIASAGLGLYVVHVHSYDRTYGSLAGAILTLVWLWVTNVALIFGAELDSELERARQLHRGIAAEERLQLVPRSERRSERAARRREKDAARGRAVREARTGAGDPEDRPF
ncbi:MAG: YihY/virulence factor BrkB family protein [Marmoricola sp.]